ncbi:hypothetical protein SK128_010109 [Halocaridina rubra]|uniref:Uncharacterized protein n=1 Tax=Halocaridina rubra TaxID=373956 RepID=A0AAN8X5M6_HALRR
MALYGRCGKLSAYFVSLNGMIRTCDHSHCGTLGGESSLTSPVTLSLSTLRMSQCFLFVAMWQIQALRDFYNFSQNSPPESRWMSLMLGWRGRKVSEGESPPEADVTQPFRTRASTDGHLHQRRLYKLRMSLNLRTSNLHERRMSIAMRGSTCGF